MISTRFKVIWCFHERYMYVQWKLPGYDGWIASFESTSVAVIRPVLILRFPQCSRLYLTNLHIALCLYLHHLYAWSIFKCDFSNECRHCYCVAFFNVYTRTLSTMWYNSQKVSILHALFASLSCKRGVWWQIYVLEGICILWHYLQSVSVASSLLDRRTIAASV